MNYVAGFMFSHDLRQVALIEKQKPTWQKGKLNGIGGKIEEGESAFEAMVREFKEETGYTEKNWIPFCILTGSWGSVHFFTVQSTGIHHLETMEREKIIVGPVSTLYVKNRIPNLEWLVPMAMTILRGYVTETGYRVMESRKILT